MCHRAARALRARRAAARDVIRSVADAPRGARVDDARSQLRQVAAQRDEAGSVSENEHAPAALRGCVGWGGVGVGVGAEWVGAGWVGIGAGSGERGGYGWGSGVR